MDAYMFAAHSKKEIMADDFWKNINLVPHNEDGEIDINKWSRCGELWYARKFWDLHDYINHELLRGEYGCGDYVEITQKDLAKIINFCCFNRDYWDSFDTVPTLCEIYAHWEELEEHGLKVFYECDW